MCSRDLLLKDEISVDEFIQACMSDSFKDEEIADLLFNVKCVTDDDCQRKAKVLRENRHNAQMIYSRMLRGRNTG